MFASILESTFLFQIQMELYNPDTQRQLIGKITLEADFLNRNSTTNDPYNTDQMAVEFQAQFPRYIFTLDQPLVFKFEDKKTISLKVKDIEGKEESNEL